MSQVNKSIQEKIEDLNQMLAWFDGDGFSIEKAMQKYKTAEALAEEIENDLIKLKNEINIIKQKFEVSE